MGTNTLTTRTDGETIPASDHNEILQALRQDLVPRNNSNAPEDIIGQLGTSALRWLRAYCQEYRVGDAANNLVISEPTPGTLKIERPDNDYIEIADGEISFYMNNVKRFAVNDGGIDWATQDDATIPKEKVDGFVFTSKTVVNLNPSNGSTPSYVLPFDAMVLTGRYRPDEQENILVWIETNERIDAGADLPNRIEILNMVAGGGAQGSFGPAGSFIAKAGDTVKATATDDAAVEIHILRLP